jgi:hypothetical protein
MLVCATQIKINFNLVSDVELFECQTCSGDKDLTDLCTDDNDIGKNVTCEVGETTCYKLVEDGLFAFPTSALPLKTKAIKSFLTTSRTLMHYLCLR